MKLIVLLMMLVMNVYAGDLLYGGLKLGTTKEVFNIGETSYLFVKPYLGLNLNKHISIETRFEFRDNDTISVNTYSDSFRIRGKVINRRRHRVVRKFRVVGRGHTMIEVPNQVTEYKGTLMLHLKF